MPPTITTTRLASRNRVSSPGDSDWKVPPTMPPSRQPGAEGEHRQKDVLDAHARGRQHLAVVDAGADQHAEPRAVEHQPHRHADHDGGDEDRDPHRRIFQIDDLAAESRMER
jgi:hypothetical protein